jgi:hypothetical protein
MPGRRLRGRRDRRTVRGVIDRAGRVITVAVLALSTAALAGCSHSPDSTAADGCSPARPHVSQDVVRPGDEVTVSVSAVTCRPTFDHDRDAEDAAAKQAFETARSAAPSADRALAGGAHLHVVFIQHRWAALHDLTTRIAHDTAWQKRHRIELSGWGADTATDSVRIALRTYTDAAAVLLVRRYGTAVTVSTTDTPYGEAF